MINLIDRALQVLQEMIKVVEAQDFEAFLTYVSPRIIDKIDRESFNMAIQLHSKKPLDVDWIDKAACKINSETSVSLVMKNGRTLTTIIKDGEKWLTDTIFWR